MKFSIAGICSILFIVPLGLADNERSASAPPGWFLEEIAVLTDGSGRWITDNAAYRSDQETYDAYGTEWTGSFGGTTMSGRLFGLENGKEAATFWEFRQYWHPTRGEVVVEQFGGGGTVGIGTMWRDGDATKAQQTFHAVSGGSRQVGHVSSFADDGAHVTESFDIVDGEWTPRRKYVWHRAPLPEKDTPIRR